MHYKEGMKVKLSEAYFLGRFPFTTFAGVRTIEGTITQVEEKFLHLQVTSCNAVLPEAGKIIRRRKQGVYRKIEVLPSSVSVDPAGQLKNELNFYLRFFPAPADLIGSLFYSFTSNSN